MALDDERVHFVHELSCRSKVLRRFEALKRDLEALLPGADMQHVGSTAIPDTLTKGDLDIQIRVSPEQYGEAKARLGKRFAVNDGGFSADDATSYEDCSGDPATGIHLTVIGGSCDCQCAFRDRLIASTVLRREYDELKRRFEGGSMDAYREAKAQFVGRVLATDEYLGSVTIGTREPINSTIYLAPYDSAWPSNFLLLADRVREALGDEALLLEHVGSTSVPGLPGKPVIDVVLAVNDSSDESSYVSQLSGQGFTLRVREPAWYEHRLLKSSDVAGNLHVFTLGCEEIDRMLAFRNWLRVHEEERRGYATVKQELAARTWKHVQHYADAKSAIISKILERTRQPPNR